MPMMLTYARSCHKDKDHSDDDDGGVVGNNAEALTGYIEHRVRVFCFVFVISNKSKQGLRDT